MVSLNKPIKPARIFSSAKPREKNTAFRNAFGSAGNRATGAERLIKVFRARKNQEMQHSKPKISRAIFEQALKAGRAESSGFFFRKTEKQTVNGLEVFIERKRRIQIPNSGLEADEIVLFNHNGKFCGFRLENIGSVK